MIYHQAKFGCKTIIISEDIVEKVIFWVPYCDLDFDETTKLNCSHSTLWRCTIIPCWLQKVERFISSGQSSDTQKDRQGRWIWQFKYTPPPPNTHTHAPPPPPPTKRKKEEKKQQLKQQQKNRQKHHHRQQQQNHQLIVRVSFKNIFHYLVLIFINARNPANKHACAST